MGSRQQAGGGDRGAILVHVALAILALVAMTTFVADYGTLWLSRRQAQNAADAGALAGAIAMAYDSTDQSNTGPAKTIAHALTQRNLVFGQVPANSIPTDITFPPCPPPFTGSTCIKVDVYRDRIHNNALPIFFGTLVGLTDQGVRATATAVATAANKTECLRPWAVLDRWDEFEGSEPDWNPGPDPDFLPDSTFDKYDDKAPEPDLYVPPAANNPGTGFNVVADEGRQFAVKVGSNGAGGNNVSPGWFRAIQIPRLDGLKGANVYNANIESCGGLPSGYAPPGSAPCPPDIPGSNGTDSGDAAFWAERGCYKVETGNMVGPTVQGVDTIIAKDPNAFWNPTKGPKGGVDQSCCALSPRVVPIGVLDIDAYLAPDPKGSNGVVRLVNIFGFFIEGIGDTDAAGNITCCSKGGQAVVGRLLTIPGEGIGSGGIDPTAAFLRTILLVR